MFVGCLIVVAATAATVATGTLLEVKTFTDALKQNPQLKLGAIDEGFPLERGSVAAPSAYLPHRQNEADALEEGAWMADLNADGDMLDSNVVFAVGPADEGYSSLWTQVDVTVSPLYAWGELRDEAQMFMHTDAGLEPIDAAFVSYAPAEVLLNRPLKVAP